MDRATPILVAALLLGGSASSTVAQATRSGDQERSVRDRVYTAEQATRGKALFRESCAACHASSEFTDEIFLFAWSGQGLHLLYDYIRTRMPEDNPGSLEPAEYAEVLAYILALNGFPDGERELPSGSDSLRRIILETPP